jgi:regulator of replication initiation timing
MEDKLIYKYSIKMTGVGIVIEDLQEEVNNLKVRVQVLERHNDDLLEENKELRKLLGEESSSEEESEEEEDDTLRVQFGEEEVIDLSHN